MDLYEILGIKRDASQDDIRKAYRRKAKTAHPDGGGTAEQFAALERAAHILGDPVKRLTYDQTGEAEEPKPDNETALALQLVQNMINALVQREVAPGSNLLVDMKGEVLRAQAEARAASVTMNHQIDRLEKLAKRFKSKTPVNLIGRMIGAHVNQCRMTIASNDQKLGVLAKARAILDGYDFEVEAPRPSPYVNPFMAQQAGLGLGGIFGT